MAQNFAAPIWMTFRQATELDAHIRKGAKGSLVVYADSITRKETDEKMATKSTGKSHSLRGTPFSMSSRSKACRKSITRKPHLHSILWPASSTRKVLRSLGATIRHGGNRAFYSIAADAIQMPTFESFQDPDSYTRRLPMNAPIGQAASPGSTVTRRASLRERRLRCRGTGCRTRSRFLCADLELALEPREDHASYIATWLKVLAADNRAVFTAAPTHTRHRIYQQQSHRRRASQLDLRGVM